jgi:putative transposase
MIAWRDKPSIMGADNGPEMVKSRLMEWAAKHQIDITHIQPGKIQQNEYVVRFNRAVRYDSYTSITGKAWKKFKSSRQNR